MVHSAVRCRVRLAAAMQFEGETLPFEDPELAGMLAAAIQIVRTALTGLPQELLSPSAPASRIDMYAVLDPDADWKLAQIALDLLGTHLSDTPPFGGMILSAPMEFMSKVMLRLQVAVPAPAAEELLPRLRFAMEAMVREVVGPDVWVDVEPAEQSDGPSAEVPRSSGNLDRQEDRNLVRLHRVGPVTKLTNPRSISGPTPMVGMGSRTARARARTRRRPSPAEPSSTVL